MKKNYYDILQINKNASPEIIEKAYKVLAKKYHPDLQAKENKKQAEERLKEINEAYEILSNPEKKQNYDDLLLSQEQKVEPNLEELLLKKQQLEQELLQKQRLEQQLEQEKHMQEIAYQEQLQRARQQAYHDAYIQDLKNRGYKIRYKKTIKDYLKCFMSIFMVMFILFLLWQIPFVQNYFLNLFKTNDLFTIFF